MNLHHPDHPHYRKIRIFAGGIIIGLGALLGLVAAILWTIPQYLMAEKLGRENPWIYWSDAYKTLLQDMVMWDLRIASLPFTVFAGAMLAFAALVFFRKHKISHRGLKFAHRTGVVFAVLIVLFILIPFHPILAYSQVNTFERPNAVELRGRITEDVKQCPILRAYLGDIAQADIVSSVAGYATYKKTPLTDISYVARLVTNDGVNHKLIIHARCVAKKDNGLECVSKERMYLYDDELSVVNAAVYCPTRDAMYVGGFDQLIPYFDHDQKAIYETKVAVSQSYADKQLVRLKQDFGSARRIAMMH